MATITVVAPKVVYPGADYHFESFVETNSTTLAAGRIAVISTGRWAAAASDPAAGTILGQNTVAGTNVTSSNPAQDIAIFGVSTVIEINSNSTGTDPTIGTAYELVVSTNDHQLDVTTTTNDVLVPIRLSPKDTTGDTNIRVYARVVGTRLYWFQGA